MDTVLNSARLTAQNRRHVGTGGVSRVNRGHGFLPAFRDRDSGAVYLSRTRSGEIAPIHLIDGLPEHLVMQRDRQGRVVRLVESVIAGFVRGTRFHTRQEAADAVREAT